MKIKIDGINIVVLTTFGFLLSFFITYVYGQSITYVYAFIELTISAFCYLGCLKHFYKLDKKIKRICLYLILVSIVSGLLNGDPKSTLLITTPLIMPLYISVWNIKYTNQKNDYIIVTLLAIIMMHFTIIDKTFGQFNSNTMGFLGFMGVSFGFIWIKCSKNKIVPIIVVIYGITMIAISGSRNVAIVGLVSFIIILIPNYIVMKKWVYSTLCTIVLLYTAFSAHFMKIGFSNEKIYLFLIEFTSNYSEKAWEMIARIDYLYSIEEIIEKRGIFSQLFGTGTLTIHGHNMFYQCVLSFGYVGTIFIYIMFIRIFQMAFTLIKANDEVALGCVLALLGNLMLQGADVYLLGLESYAIIPQILIGILLNRYRKRKILLNIAE